MNLFDKKLYCKNYYSRKHVLIFQAIKMRSITKAILIYEERCVHINSVLHIPGVLITYACVTIFWIFCNIFPKKLQFLLFVKEFQLKSKCFQWKSLFSYASNPSETSENVPHFTNYTIRTRTISLVAFDFDVIRKQWFFFIKLSKYFVIITKSVLKLNLQPFGNRNACVRNGGCCLLYAIFMKLNGMC